ncbi:TetR family transcriptional regulator [Actinomadura sp. DSM 109109]|nr:TetR family transcriptional regulator [Actinomadura lepetitiana]
MSDEISRAHVLEVATRLFGQLGYDGTSLQLISDVLGVGPAVVAEVAGDKRALYQEVMRQAFEAEREMLEAAVARSDSARAAVHEIVDAYLDFHVANPQNRALWAHRWVSDAVDFSTMEDQYARPLLQIAARRIKDAVPPDVNTYYLLGTMVWCVHGFLGSGILRPDHGMKDAAQPGVVESFRAHLHVLMDRLLAPWHSGPDDPGSPARLSGPPSE